MSASCGHCHIEAGRSPSCGPDSDASARLLQSQKASGAVGHKASDLEGKVREDVFEDSAVPFHGC